MESATRQSPLARRVRLLFRLAGSVRALRGQDRRLDAMRNADLLLALAHAMGELWPSFGEQSSGPLPGVLS